MITQTLKLFSILSISQKENCERNINIKYELYITLCESVVIIVKFVNFFEHKQTAVECKLSKNNERNSKRCECLHPSYCPSQNITSFPPHVRRFSLKWPSSEPAVQSSGHKRKSAIIIRTFGEAIRIEHEHEPETTKALGSIINLL